jgi:two-component system KDP operon response regulator KdpE
MNGLFVEAMMNPISGQVLIVEDEVNIRAGLRDTLLKDEHVVIDAGSGEEALAKLKAIPCDAAVVDIRMPGMSGIELLQAIRAQWQHISVIMLTGHGDLESAMAAVKAGAHDYLLKPAHLEQIRQTVREAVSTSRWRRKQASLLESLRAGLADLEEGVAGQNPAPPTSSETRSLDMGRLHLNFSTYELERDGIPIHLSPTEFKLLTILAVHLDEVIDYATLARLSLGYEPELWEAKELVKRHVLAIRRKIEVDPATPHYIINVRGVGYRLVLPRDD